MINLNLFGILKLYKILCENGAEVCFLYFIFVINFNSIEPVNSTL